MLFWLLVNFLLFLFCDVNAFEIGGTSESDDDLVIEPLPHLKLYKKDNSYYYFGTVYKGNFFKSWQYCQFHGMNLVSIETVEENDFLYKSLHKIYNMKGDYHFWTSGSILPDGAGGPFVWLSTGLPFTYTNWAPSQPDFAGKSEKCTEVIYNPTSRTSLIWNDNNCDVAMYLICETTSVKSVTNALSNENNCNVTFIGVRSQ